MMDEKKERKSEVDVVELGFTFAVNIVKLVDKLPRTTAGFELGRQVIRSGTSIGANAEEAQGARTKPEFINSMNIAKREARESCFWLRVIQATGLLRSDLVEVRLQEAQQLRRMLTAIVKTAEGH